MRLEGKLWKHGRAWIIHVPILGVVTQGKSEKDAYGMIVDAVELLVDRKGFRVKIHRGESGRFEVSANQPAALTGEILRRMRARAGLTLADMAKRLGARSINSWARYEQGRAVPTVAKLTELFKAVSPGRDFVIAESSARD